MLKLSLCLSLLSLYFIAQALNSEIPTSPTHTEVTREVQVVQSKSNKVQTPIHLQLAMADLGVKEQPKGSNRGKQVDAYNSFLKLIAVPWCGTSGSKWLDKSDYRPRVKSGRAKDFAVKKYSHTLNQVLHGFYNPKPGDFRVKTRRGGHHIDFFVSWDKNKQEGYVIGGNVSDAVTIRKVTLRSMIADGTTHIVEVKNDFRK